MSTAGAGGPKHVRTGLRQQLLLAALECSGGDLGRTFTAEDLLLAAWGRDPLAWGLRGHERAHPDSERIYKELDRVKVGELLEKVRQRTYRLTPAGLASASAVAGAKPEAAEKAERALADAVTEIISHPVFRAWIIDPAAPKHFRDAGYFWGIAPGTPPSAIRSRIGRVDKTLEAALSLLDDLGTDEISARPGQALYQRRDIQRAMEFQATLKERFSKDLAALQADQRP